MFVQPRPFAHETSCPYRPELSGKQFSGEIECRQLSLILDVKMRRFVIIEEHPDNYPEER